MTSLHDFLDSQEEIENESFAVMDEKQANWALRKIKQYKDQIDQNNALADAEIEKIERWNNQEREKAQQNIDSFQALLADYAMEKRKEDPGFKSIKLPNGRIGFRKRQPKWDYDNEKVIKALEDAKLKDLIRVKKEPIKTDIKKAFNAIGGKVINPKTGEVVEGITVTEQPDNFNVVVD